MVDIVKPTSEQGFPWGRYALLPDIPLVFQIGDLTLWCKSVGSEIWIAQQYSAGKPEDDRTASLEPPDTSTWSRWALRSQDPAEIRIDPAYPNLPLVVRPEMPFRLIEEAQARIYVRVPLWVQIQLFGPPNISLMEAPVVTLSKTWFGSFTEGHLCYSMTSGARRQIAPDLLRPYMSICPLEIRNKSKEELRVEKLSLQVENLSIFRKKGQLWADETKITFRGHMTGTEIESTGMAPTEASGAELLASSRNPLRKGFASATFAGLKALPGLGFFLTGD